MRDPLCSSVAARGFDGMLYLSIIFDGGLIVGKLESLMLQH